MTRNTQNASAFAFNQHPGLYSISGQTSACQQHSRQISGDSLSLTGNNNAFPAVFDIFSVYTFPMHVSHREQALISN